MYHSRVPCKLQHKPRDPQPLARRVEALQPAARRHALAGARAAVEHAPQQVCLGGIGGLLEALAHPRLALGAYLRVEALLVLAEAVEALLALGVVGVVGVGEVLRERCAQQVLVLEAGGAKGGVAGRARGGRDGARDGVLARGGLLLGCDGRVGDVAVLELVVSIIPRCWGISVFPRSRPTSSR